MGGPGLSSRRRPSLVSPGPGQPLPGSLSGGAPCPRACSFLSRGQTPQGPRASPGPVTSAPSRTLGAEVTRRRLPGLPRRFAHTRPGQPCDRRRAGVDERRGARARALSPHSFTSQLCRAPRWGGVQTGRHLGDTWRLRGLPLGEDGVRGGVKGRERAEPGDLRPTSLCGCGRSGAALLASGWSCIGDILYEDLISVLRILNRAV